MFYQQTIKGLRATAEANANACDTFKKLYESTSSELEIVQEAFREKVEVTEELKEDLAAYQSVNCELEAELADVRLANDDLAQRNRDLEYQNGLLVTVLQTLRIPVKLPARNKRA